MTYEEKKQRVIAKLEDSGYDSVEEWAESILRAIGETEDADEHYNATRRAGMT